MTVSPVEMPPLSTSPGAACAVDIFEMPPTDALYLTTATRQIAGDYPHDTASLLDAAASLTGRLPGALLDRLHRFRIHEDAAALVVRTLRVDDTAIGPTPLDWRDPLASHHALAVRAHEVFLLLMASVLGDVYGWNSQQDGRLVHDVLPIPGEQLEQTGHGTVMLQWHTEDAFHPHRPDFLLLFGMRNHAAVPTTVASVRDITLDPRHRAVLTEPRFLIRPDTEHLNRAQELSTTRGGSAHPVWQRGLDPQPCAVLSGPPHAPYLRIDPPFMTAQPGDHDAAEALTALMTTLDHGLTGVALRPGELLIVNNHTTVHGRREFQAAYDGTDRWLKKAIVTRDLRRARAEGHASHDRVLN